MRFRFTYADGHKDAWTDVDPATGGDDLDRAVAAVFATEPGALRLTITYGDDVGSKLQYRRVS